VEAMKVEYNSIMKNRTCALVDHPTKCKVIGTKWVYKAKYKYDMSLEKYKAQLVAKSFAEVKCFNI